MGGSRSGRCRTGAGLFAGWLQSLTVGNSPGNSSRQGDLQGEPLPARFLFFHTGEVPVEVGAIKSDGTGTYEASVPAGLVQVTVRWDVSLDRAHLPFESGSCIPVSRPRPVPHIPDVDLNAKQAKLLDEVQRKYGSLKTPKSLTFDVGAGEQTWNINLD